MTPLAIAAKDGRTDVVRLLLENGANVNAWDWARVGTPLSFAARFGHRDVVILLIAKGADVKRRSIFQRRQ